MSRNERAGGCWSQPPRPTLAKNRSGCSRRLGSEDMDEIGDIVNALSSGERRMPHKGDSWKNKSSTLGEKYSSDCCLKNGLVQCQCLWNPQNKYPEWQRNHNGAPKMFNGDSLSYSKKASSWSSPSGPNGFIQDNKMLEEFILDDNELCLLNYYDIPLKVSRRHVRNTGKVKTVSIIDTLSELASGATDREDEGGFSSAVSESAVLNRYLHKPKARQVRQPPPRRNIGSSCRSGPLVSSNCSLPVNSTPIKKPTFPPPIRADTDSFSSIYSSTFSDGSLPCSSLKRTLKYLRKAVASNVVQEENRYRRTFREKPSDEDAFRQCFSDSEVKESSVRWTPLKHSKLQQVPRAKSKSLLTVNEPVKQTVNLSSYQNRSKGSVPDWIQEVFEAAKKGDVDKMKTCLQDIDPALVRNISDTHGNNLWHMCAAQNNLECLNWLCSRNAYHSDALKDENKNGLSPAALAVKHGSLLAVQWLIHNTVSKSQLLLNPDSRSLLHIAAKYGQYSIVEWLLNYMSSQDLDANIVDSEGNNALHLAAKYGFINCVKVLVFQIGNLKSKNEQGLKPLDLAVKHGKSDCADFLAALESTYNLASLNLHQYSDIQHLQKENAEMKSYFKELLILTKRLQHRQKELVQSFTRMNVPPDAGDWIKDRNVRYFDDYSQLLATVMTDEEHRLLMVENKWKKSRKQTKQPDSKEKPLDILRFQYNHVMDKVKSLSSPIPSTPESSDGSSHGGNEEIYSPQKPYPDLSTPDVVNSLFPQTSVPYLGTRQKYESEHPAVNPVSKVRAPENTLSRSPEYSAFKKPNPPPVPSSRDVNLRMFFKQNPNLRQSVETCSVLEVLEPSSSDGEECLGHKKKLTKNINSEKETEQSSSNSALETLGPYSGRPSSSGSKASGSLSSSSGGVQNSFKPNVLSGENLQNDASHPSTSKGKVSDGTSSEMNKSASEELSTDINLAEPDLIKGTQKKKMVTPFSTMERERKYSKDSSDMVLTDNPTTTDSESLDADRSFSNAAEGNAMPQACLDSSVEVPTAKKKSFLFKFALRGRWPSKAGIRSLKNEISPEEFRETYSRTSLEDKLPSPSQISAIPNSPVRPLFPPSPKQNIESVHMEEDKRASISCDITNDLGLFPVTPPNSLNQNSLPRKGLLPPRRDPPPAPPLDDNNDDQSQLHSDDDISINIQKSSVSSCIEGSLNNSFLNSRSPDLWHSTNSKSHFRPASSASRVDSPSRGEGSFPLNKSSSASTEMLSALDSSTAGRQSPAPSEVSKTESALSPPSDVSKTESTRYLSQLGKIDESGHLTGIKVSSLQTSNEQNIIEAPLPTEAKSPVKAKKSKKANSNKPWYEFSDEEDVIVPQRYQGVSVSMRGSSEDEGAVTG